ncbi:Potassium uptake protein, integral membrane component, KtrA [Mycoplasmopsis meleagridis]|uniref:Potassium uptake protein, integral membranecomponent, KtrA n=1 Tax=Mycoplasmopsis meleagridis ATCC 25294 TaxID=1264554 RepID=A0A0F5H0Z2_9BACT|nr:TrkA family potassium uptake protein [Mycoplasmopsis meleagridis]KKB27001.1 Potassium uptake protein, integral membranecomponent, KtrA [Mycoplasmopsis meleagridis ATCC 25294]OAD18348.1 Potassium uptake protein, integral membrane component, KtrA [Mycoplasmopsis meleagridis]VEU77478.1 potassium uptake protein A [Mycoplasmopsis meleagridis]
MLNKKKNEDICVIGAGRFGSAVISQLIKMDSSIMIIDKNEEVLKNYTNQVEKIVIGDAADIKTLKALNIKNMDTVVVSISDNIEIVASLLELKVSNIIARATSKRHALVLKQIGVNVIIQPEYEAGIRTAILAANSNFIKYSKNLQEIANGFVMGTTYVTNNQILNKEIKDLKFNDLGISVVLIKRETQFILPNGFTTILPNDLLTIIGKVSDVNNAISIFNEK